MLNSLLLVKTYDIYFSDENVYIYIEIYIYICEYFSEGLIAVIALAVCGRFNL